jgi:hypothetical protein
VTCLVPRDSVAMALSLLVLMATNAGAQNVNLGIADDETLKRPNSWSQLHNRLTPHAEILAGDTTGPASRPAMSIAWRNARQVEEVEVKVRNLGTDAGEGSVAVDILDETGRVLLHLEPPPELQTIRVPGVDQGGREGKILRMKASWELNTLIDRFDRVRTRYGVRAQVQTKGPDTDPFDNAKVKSWNIPFAVKRGMTNAYNYIFQNHGSDAVTVMWRFEHTPPPAGWQISGVPESKEAFTLKPGEQIRGTLLMQAPMQITEGAFLEARLSLVRAADNSLFQQHEWFQVYDTEPPHVSNYRVVLTDDHRVAIQALVADQGSGVLEATGVSTEFSTDGGRTWAKAAHNYKTGNFVRPTLFETYLGPFAPNTPLRLRFSAMDTAGNVQTIIPDDAAGLDAPPKSSALLDEAYIFPRTQPNAIFDIDTLADLKIDANRLKSLNIDVNTMSIEAAAKALQISPDTLRANSIDVTRLQEMKSNLEQIGKLGIAATQMKTFPLKRVPSPGDALVNLTTLEVTVK